MKKRLSIQWLLVRAKTDPKCISYYRLVHRQYSTCWISIHIYAFEVPFLFLSMACSKYRVALNALGCVHIERSNGVFTLECDTDLYV